SDTDRTPIGDETAQYAWQSVFTGGAGASDFEQVYQRMENVRRSGAKTVTLSFWAKAAVAGLKLGLEIVQGFGSGGSPSANTQTLAGVVTLTTTWARYTVTATLPSLAGVTL